MPVIQAFLNCAAGMLATVGRASRYTGGEQQNSPQIDISAPAYVPINKRSVDAVSWGRGRFDAFAIGANSEIYHKYWNGPFEDSNWESLGGQSITPPTAVSTKHLDLHVFHVDTSSRVYVKQHSNSSSWTDWINLSGTITSNLAAVSWGSDHVDIFGLGGPRNTTPYHKSYDGGTWNDSWESLNGEFKSEIAAVSWGPGRIDIFAIGLNDSMYTKAFSEGKWENTWTSLGGSFTSPPTIVSWAHGRLDVFGVDSRGMAVQKQYLNGWSNSWTELDGGIQLFSALSAVISSFFGAKRIDLFALGEGNQLYRKTYNEVTKAWEGWYQHGHPFHSKPHVVSWGSKSLDVLALSMNTGAVWHQSWNSSDWHPSVTGWTSEGGLFKTFR